MKEHKRISAKWHRGTKAQRDKGEIGRQGIRKGGGQDLRGGGVGNQKAKSKKQNYSAKVKKVQGAAVGRVSIEIRIFE